VKSGVGTTPAWGQQITCQTFRPLYRTLEQSAAIGPVVVRLWRKWLAESATLYPPVPIFLFSYERELLVLDD
jgi:hypothetical protein